MHERKVAPYIFHGQTTALCEDCLALVPAKVIIEGDNVFHLKRCAEHGVQKTLVSTDAGYFRRCDLWRKPGDRPLAPQTRTEFGCPYDCGLCPDHEQHSCLALIEINEHCNLTCPICFADSSPARTRNRSLAEVETMLDALVASEGEADVLQISGGEPSLHPQILDILRLAKTKPIRHVMLNTNGLRIAGDPAFVAGLAELGPGFEVYLQFDSLRETALRTIRGADLRRVRDKALAALEAAGVSTTLVVVVKRGANDGEVGDIIRHALTYRCVRGVTFQPVQDAGRNVGFDKLRDRVMLSDIRRAVIEQCDVFDDADMIPLPCNPDLISIGYGLRNGSTVVPVTSLLPADLMTEAMPNAIAFEKHPELRRRIEALFSLSTVGNAEPERLGALLCCLPEFPVPEDLGYENIFRVTIVQFLDRFNFCLAQVKRSCIHFVTETGQIIPFDTYNLFYRDGEIERHRARVTNGYRPAMPENRP